MWKLCNGCGGGQVVVVSIDGDTLAHEMVMFCWMLCWDCICICICTLYFVFCILYFVFEVFCFSFVFVNSFCFFLHNHSLTYYKRATTGDVNTTVSATLVPAVVSSWPLMPTRTSKTSNGLHVVDLTSPTNSKA